MFSLISTLLGLAPSALGLANKIADARVELAKAQTDKDKIAAEERVNALRVQQQGLVGDPAAAWVRVAFTAPFVAYVWKLVLWDKLITGGTGNTDPLGADLWSMMMMIVGFYFLHWTIGRFRG